MKTCTIAAMAAFAIGQTLSAQPTVAVKRAIVVNKPTSSGTFNAPTDHTVVIGQAGSNQVTSFQTALQFEFLVEGSPVNVSNFKMTRGDFTLVRNGSIVPNWNKSAFGSYHPIDQGSPDYLPFNAAGASVMPTGMNQWVSDLNGDGLGVVLPSVSKFQVVNHPVGLGTTTRPLLSAVGDYYTLWYDIVINYQYGEGSYTKTFTPSETVVSILVTNNVDTWNGGSTKPTKIVLELSDNLADWQVADVSVPTPLPKVVPNIIALVPKTTSVPGLSADRRFYRFKQETIE